jgi:heterodisulfide reductase subunit A
MANIREHVSWVHSDREMATKKAKSLITAAVKRVNFHEELEKRTVEVDPATLVIGGGISGISAALEIANSGRQVYLIEKKSSLGGIVSNLDLLYPYMDSAQDLINPKIKLVENHPFIKVFLNTEIVQVFGYVGNFNTKIIHLGEEIELKFGNIIVATGLKPYSPETIHAYGYGEFDNVITSLDLEKMLRKGEVKMKDGKIPENVAIIHCVGSRNSRFKEYCSRTCCMTAIKFSNQLRSALPNSNIYEMYADMRSFGKDCEEMYAETSKKNIMFLMFDQQNDMPQIRKAYNGSGCDMLIELEDRLSGEVVEVPADLVVLMLEWKLIRKLKKLLMQLVLVCVGMISILKNILN